MMKEISGCQSLGTVRGRGDVTVIIKVMGMFCILIKALVIGVFQCSKFTLT